MFSPKILTYVMLGQMLAVMFFAAPLKAAPSRFDSPDMEAAVKLLTKATFSKPQEAEKNPALKMDRMAYLVQARKVLANSTRVDSPARRRSLEFVNLAISQLEEGQESKALLSTNEALSILKKFLSKQ
jgi:hypothetical protein